VEIARVQLWTPNFFTFSVDFSQAVGYSISTMKLKYDARLHKIVNGKIVFKTVAELIEDEKQRSKARNELSAMGIKITAF